MMWEGQLTVGHTTHGLVVLCALKQQAEQAMKSKQASKQYSFMASSSSSCLHVLALTFLSDEL